MKSIGKKQQILTKRVCCFHVYVFVFMKKFY